MVGLVVFFVGFLVLNLETNWTRKLHTVSLSHTQTWEFGIAETQHLGDGLDGLTSNRAFYHPTKTTLLFLCIRTGLRNEVRMCAVSIIHIQTCIRYQRRDDSNQIVGGSNLHTYIKPCKRCIISGFPLLYFCWSLAYLTLSSWNIKLILNLFH